MINKKNLNREKKKNYKILWENNRKLNNRDNLTLKKKNKNFKILLKGKPLQKRKEINNNSLQIKKKMIWVHCKIFLNSFIKRQRK
jgi:hypothetical protein